jgi:peptidoglycan DL-endopeptidase CwlO
VRLLLASAVAISCSCTGTIDDGPDAPEGPERPVRIEGPAVLVHVQRFANTVCGATEACTISTYDGHHPSAARAVDILVSDDYGRAPTDHNKLGDAVSAFALAHQYENGISYVIFRQRINMGDGWEAMEDRGSITQNHYDHVHVSFEDSAP